MSSAFNKVKSVGSSLFGGQSSAVQGSNYKDLTPEEVNRLKSIEGDLEKYQGQQGQDVPGVGDINELFKQHLTSFLTADHGPNPTPEQQAAASAFVDQTFTQPTQNALQQYQSQFEAAQGAKAAALGRNPNLDQSTIQANFAEGLRNNTNLQAERGSRIATTAQGFNQQGFDRGLNSLNAGLQGSNFLNTLTQNAFSNRLNLLNARSAIGDKYQKERGLTTTNNMQTNPGIVGNITGGINQLSGLAKSVKSFGGQFAGPEGLGGNTGQLGQ